MPRGGLQTSLVSMVNMLAASCNGRSSRVTGRTRRNADARISAAMAQGDDEDAARGLSSALSPSG